MTTATTNKLWLTHQQYLEMTIFVTWLNLSDALQSLVACRYMVKWMINHVIAIWLYDSFDTLGFSPSIGHSHLLKVLCKDRPSRPGFNLTVKRLFVPTFLLPKPVYLYTKEEAKKDTLFQHQDENRIENRISCMNKLSFCPHILWNEKKWLCSYLLDGREVLISYNKCLIDKSSKDFMEIFDTQKRKGAQWNM